MTKLDRLGLSTARRVNLHNEIRQAIRRCGYQITVTIANGDIDDAERWHKAIERLQILKLENLQ